MTAEHADTVDDAMLAEACRKGGAPGDEHPMVISI